MEIKFNNFLKLNEYVTREGGWLMDYFKADKEEREQNLPYDYYHLLDDFLYENDIDFEKPANLEDHEIVDYLHENDKELFNEFASWLYDNTENHQLDGVPDSEYPSWSFYDNSPELVKNQWLIHFTDYANDITQKGFKYGVDNIDKLGLTTYLSQSEKAYGGFNFAYLLKDFPRYAAKMFGGYKYGKDAILFRASGIRVYHYGDEEYQVIFYGNTAKNIIPIINDKNTDEWVIESTKTFRTLYKSEKLEKVTDWVVQNYDQYRKQL